MLMLQYEIEIFLLPNFPDPDLSFGICYRYIDKVFNLLSLYG